MVVLVAGNRFGILKEELVPEINKRIPQFKGERLGPGQTEAEQKAAAKMKRQRAQNTGDRTTPPPSYDADDTTSFMTAMMGGAFWGGAYAAAVDAMEVTGSESDENEHTGARHAGKYHHGGAAESQSYRHDYGRAGEDDGPDYSSHDHMDVPHEHADQYEDTDATRARAGSTGHGGHGGSSEARGLFWGAPPDAPASHCTSESESSEDSVEETVQYADPRCGRTHDDDSSEARDCVSECSEEFSPSVAHELADPPEMPGRVVTFINNGQTCVFGSDSTAVGGDGLSVHEAGHAGAAPPEVEEDSAEDLNAWRARDTESSAGSDEDEH